MHTHKEDQEQDNKDRERSWKQKQEQQEKSPKENKAKQRIFFYLGRMMSPPKILGLTRILRWALDLDVNSKLLSSSVKSPLKTAATALSGFFFDFLGPPRFMGM